MRAFDEHRAIGGHVAYPKIWGMYGGIEQNLQQAIPPNSLTQMAIKNAAIRDKPYKLSDGGGLYLLVQPNDAAPSTLKRNRRLLLNLAASLVLAKL